MSETTTTTSSIAPAPYRPERVSPPGNTIRDILDEIDMSQAELARRMGRPPNKINKIIQGKKAITADTALELESVLGLPASFWMNREQNYQLALSQLEQLEEQEQACEIAKDFPCAQMARLGWIEKKTSWLEKYQQLLRFFASAKLNALNAAVELAPSFRNSDGKNACQKALAAWLRKGVLESQKIHAAEFCKERARQHLESIWRAYTGRSCRTHRRVAEGCSRFRNRRCLCPAFEGDVRWRCRILACRDADYSAKFSWETTRCPVVQLLP